MLATHLPMRTRTLPLFLLMLLAGAGCAPDLTCSDPQPYQSAVEVERVEAPEGLDDLAAGAEMDIPRASPRDERSETDPCLDLPPTIQATPDD